MSDLLHLWLPVSARKSSAHMKQIPRTRCNCSLIENCRFPPQWLDSSQQPCTRMLVRVICRDTARKSVTVPNWPSDETPEWWFSASSHWKCTSAQLWNLNLSVRKGFDFFYLFFCACLRRSRTLTVRDVQGSELLPKHPVFGIASGSKELLLWHVTTQRYDVWCVMHVPGEWKVLACSASAKLR